MHRLPQQIIVLVLISFSVFAQSPHGNKFNVDCSQCHNSENWEVNLGKVKFDHSKTGFSLTGQHQAVNCRSCHASLEFTSVSKDCNSCHTDIHQGTVGFSCNNCHTPESWIVRDINKIHQSSRFPLLGAHKLADCIQCHQSFSDLRFDVQDIECYACHAADYASAKSPNHIAGNYSKDCQECHNISSILWNSSNVNHSFFPLAGGHALPSCTSCHQQNTFTGLSPECYSCHKANYDATKDPNHIASGFPITCNVCHSIYGWEPAKFDHNNTQFPLTGKHINVSCNDCHKTGYTSTPQDCYSCHQKDYQSAQDPNHIQQNFPTDCQQCHTTSGWEGATFNHNLSKFPLTGAHIQVNCSDCHSSGYSGISTECVSCHQSNYQQSTNPNHTALSLPTNCESCHTTNPGWTPATFTIHNNYYPLVGAHTQINNCYDCHKGNYNTTPNTCYGCHASDYVSASNPPHQLQNFSQDCTACHNMNGWSGATFDHNFYPTGTKHTKVSCNECHSLSAYQPQCLSCHLNDFLDKHRQGDRTDCWNCHTTRNWD